MSAEIDAFCEVFRDGSWQSTTPSYQKRIFPLRWDPGANNYELFNVLGCARRPERVVAVPIAEERGLPKDSCPQLVSLYGSDDFTPRFNPSWLLLSELLSYLEKHENSLEDFIRIPLQDLVRELLRFGEPDCVRIVFWLDN